MFAVLLENTWSPADASAVARRILAAIRRPILVGDEELKVTASVGIAVGAAGETGSGTGGSRAPVDAAVDAAVGAGDASPADAFADRAALALGGPPFRRRHLRGCRT